MSENGEIYTAGNKFYTPAGTDRMDKFHLCLCFFLILVTRVQAFENGNTLFHIKYSSSILMHISICEY